MNQSFFAALRLAVMLLTIDGKVTLRERAWFIQLQQQASFHLTKEQKEILRKDLARTATLPEVTELFTLVTEPQDRARLLKLLRSAMVIDGPAGAQNLEFFRHVENLNRSTPTVVNTLARESQRWSDLEKSTSVLNKEQKMFVPSRDLLKTDFYSALFLYFPGKQFLIIVILLTLFALSFSPRYQNSRYRHFFRRTGGWHGR